MDAVLTLAPSELLLGGQRSGKSRRAEALAAAWLAAGSGREAVLVATARGLDAEMQDRIRRHQDDRAARLPALRTVEEPLHVGRAIDAHSSPATLVVVDCLTLWLSAWMVPAPDAAGAAVDPYPFPEAALAALLAALAAARGPVVLVSNEIGLGVIPGEVLTRRFVDALGRLNQRVAQACSRVTLMVAGMPVCVKDLP